jgi:hypothetical protein
MSENGGRVSAVHIWTIRIGSGETIRPLLEVLELCAVHSKLITDLKGLLDADAIEPDE